MYRTVQDFLEDWKVSSAGTLNVLKAISNKKGISQSLKVIIL